jgi:hypothetical protein
MVMRSTNASSVVAPMPTERCSCGHNREAHPLYRGICTCGITRLENGQDAPNGDCMGWPGTTGAEALEEAAGLREHILDIAAHATPYGDLPEDPGYIGTYLLTAGALHRALGTIGHSAPSCIAEAELDEARSRIHLLEVEACDLEHRRLVAEDRHADLQVHCVELADLIRSIEWYGTRCNADITGCEDEDVCPVCDCSVVEGHKPNCRLAAVLQVDGTTQGHAILQEVERLREAIREALPHVPYRVEQDLRDALDQAAQPEVIP